MSTVEDLEAKVNSLNSKLNQAKVSLLKALLDESSVKVGDRAIDGTVGASPIYVISRGELSTTWRGFGRITFYGKKVLKDGHSLHSLETRLYAPKKCDPDLPKNK